MTEISSLMALFASKVVEQQEEMEGVFATAVTAHENVKRGGQHLDKAEERDSAFRKFYVVFMLVMTFALLFLHAYNP
jgi:t-SNARE complex subunit (syntaxin)